jgi:hypothetical protein
MAALFLLFLIAGIIACYGHYKIAIGLALLNLLLCIWMFFHHATDHLKVLL